MSGWCEYMEPLERPGTAWTHSSDIHDGHERISVPLANGGLVRVTVCAEHLAVIQEWLEVTR